MIYKLNQGTDRVRGFTLAEIVVVVMVIAILSLALSNTWNAPAIDVNLEAQRLLDDLRYTQALSVTTGQRYRWVKLSSTSYQITNEAGSAIMLPSGSTQLTFSAGVSFGTLGNLPNNLVAFSSLGVPYTDSSIPGTALASAATIPLTANGVTRTVQIIPQTGAGVLA